MIAIEVGALATVPKGLEERLKELEISGNHPDNSIVEIG